MTDKEKCEEIARWSGKWKYVPSRGFNADGALISSSYWVDLRREESLENMYWDVPDYFADMKACLQDLHVKLVELGYSIVINWYSSKLKWDVTLIGQDIKSYSDMAEKLPGAFADACYKLAIGGK